MKLLTLEIESAHVFFFYFILFRPSAPIFYHKTYLRAEGLYNLTPEIVTRFIYGIMARPEIH